MDYEYDSIHRLITIDLPSVRNPLVGGTLALRDSVLRLTLLGARMRNVIMVAHSNQGAHMDYTRVVAELEAMVNSVRAAPDESQRTTLGDAINQVICFGSVLLVDPIYGRLMRPAQAR